MSENTETSSRNVGRNEPCPCGSQKKYKRCCGQNAAPVLSTPAPVPSGMPAPGKLPPGMENVDPQLMAQASQAIQRLPRAQLQKLQSIMQRAMAGQDVAAEAATLEKMLPPEFQTMMQGVAMQMNMGAGMPGAASSISDAPDAMSEEEAKKIVAAAAAEGKLSQAEASELLQKESKASGGMGKFWRGLTGKK